MEQTVPIIYSPRLGPAKLSLGARILALSIGLGCLAVLVTAAIATPSHTGVGTHEGLGLQKCTWLQNFGFPCPSCGMTTSFAWFVRGNLAASFYVQPMGMILAICTAIAAWAGLYEGLSGRAVHRLVRPNGWMPLVIVLMFTWVAAWGWKIWIHVHGIDGW